MGDLVLLERAKLEARILLTLDKDFWQIAMQRRPPLEKSGVVLSRARPATPGNLAPLMRAFCEARAALHGHIRIVTSSGIEMVPARRK